MMVVDGLMSHHALLLGFVVFTATVTTSSKVEFAYHGGWLGCRRRRTRSHSSSQFASSKNGGGYGSNGREQQVV